MQESNWLIRLHPGYPVIFLYLFGLTLGLFSSLSLCAQATRMQGRVTNARMEPLSFVTVQIKDHNLGTRTDEEGRFSFMLEEGQYEMVFSLIGYKKQKIKLVHQAGAKPVYIMLEEDQASLAEVKIVSFRKDKAEEIIRQVIRRKDSILQGYHSYSADVYIRATDEEVHQLTAKQKARLSDSAKKAIEQTLPDMSLSEISLQLDYEYPNKIKEKRNAVKNRGNHDGLFFLSTTEGDFSLYHNLLHLPALSQTPMLSPLSYSGLIAYHYKTRQIRKSKNATFYTIHFTPGRLGNALLEGELTIVDSSWTVVSSHFTLPEYHLPEYSYFEVTRAEELVDGKAWLPVRQEFIYRSREGRHSRSGRTIAVYDHYRIDTQFAHRYFNREISSTDVQAYQHDSAFWNTIRKEPLTDKEVRYIIKSDSTYRAQHSKPYLDSIDHQFNRITALKLLFLGQQHYQRSREETLSLDPVINMFRFFMPGGTRIQCGGAYDRIFPSKKTLMINGELSYGFYNRDLMGTISCTHRYNPFSNGYFSLSAGRSFDLIFTGDAYINLFRRSNFYIKNSVELEHGVELLNGLILRNRFEFADRESLAGLKLTHQFDSVFHFNNEPVSFQPYHACYGVISLEYTPFSMYIREPHQKIILGSRYPTFYASWRKGLPGLLQSKVSFDYIEYGLFQKINLGLAGVSQYRIFSGDFIRQPDLRYIDYKFISRGNPGLFNNPLLSFQNLDSTFAIFHRFYEAHYIHRFNGAILNKLPFIKKLHLLEVAGGGLLYVPERKLRYAEAYVGLEKIVPLFREKFKFGVYYVGSIANKENRPLQLKIGLDVFDKRKNTWH